MFYYKKYLKYKEKYLDIKNQDGGSAFFSMSQQEHFLITSGYKIISITTSDNKILKLEKNKIIYEIDMSNYPNISEIKKDGEIIRIDTTEFTRGKKLLSTLLDNLDYYTDTNARFFPKKVISKSVSSSSGGSIDDSEPPREDIIRAQHLQRKEKSGGGSIDDSESHPPLETSNEEYPYRNIYIYNESYSENKIRTSAKLLSLPENKVDIILFEDNIETKLEIMTKAGVKSTIPIANIIIKQVIEFARNFFGFLPNMPIDSLVEIIKKYRYSSLTPTNFLGNPLKFFNIYKDEMIKMLKLLEESTEKSRIIQPIIKLLNTIEYTDIINNTYMDKIEQLQNICQELLFQEIIKKLLNENNKINQQTPFVIITDMPTLYFDLLIERLKVYWYFKLSIINFKL